MLPESTTTTGDSLPVMHIHAFHIISADVTIIPGIKSTHLSEQILCKKVSKPQHDNGNLQTDFYFKVKHLYQNIQICFHFNNTVFCTIVIAEAR